ncbi:Nucleolar complex protein 3 [Phlyctochytrium bullatum]|nr:Nucleolar complex protein 3 [Phlyctochytrium bullatum]
MRQRTKQKIKKQFSKRHPAKEKPVVAEPDDDSDIDLSDEDMDIASEYGNQLNFLMKLDPKTLNKSDPSSKNGKAVQPKHQKQAVEEDDDDNLDMIQVRSDDEEDDDDYSDLSDNEATGADDDADSDDENERDFELEARKPAGWMADAVPKRLPVKTPEGRIVQVKEAPASTNKQDEKQDNQPEHAALKKKKKEKKKKAEKGSMEVKAKAEPVKSVQALRMEAQEELAAIASSIMENPEEKASMLKRFKDISRTHDTHILKLCLLTQLAVFKDIIPGYRIRPLTDIEKQQKVSKEVKQLRSYEEGLLSNYQSYLQLLETTLRSHLAKQKTEASGDAKQDQVQDPSVAVVCVRCLGELITTAAHFNFRNNILTAIVAHAAVQNPKEISIICCNALKKLFEADVSGEASLEAVKLIAKFVKTRNFRVPPEVLGTFLHLRLKDEMQLEDTKGKKSEKSDDVKAGKKRKHEEKVHMSKKARKVAKLEAEVEKEMREAEAEVDKEFRQKNHSETLKLVFTTYFRVLKGSRSSTLLPVVLEGLSRFAHLISVDFFSDLIKVLKEIAVDQAEKYNEGSDEVLTETTLHCIVAAYRILSGQGSDVFRASFTIQILGEMLNIDLKDFNTLLYAQLLRIAVDPTASIKKSNVASETSGELRHMLDEKKLSETGLALLGVDLSFKKKKQVPITRAAAYFKRIMTIALLDSDERLGTGSYNPFLDDPELCNPFAATTWEVNLLQRTESQARRTVGPSMYSQSDFMKGIEEESGNIIKRNRYAGEGVEDDLELDELVAKEEKLRKLVEMAREAHLDLLDEDASSADDLDDDGGEAEIMDVEETEEASDVSSSESDISKFLHRNKRKKKRSRKGGSTVLDAARFLASL